MHILGYREYNVLTKVADILLIIIICPFFTSTYSSYGNNCMLQQLQVADSTEHSTISDKSLSLSTFPLRSQTTILLVSP